MIKMHKMLPAIAMLLCFVVISPTFIEPTLIAQTRAQPKLISVQTQTEMKTIEVLGKSIPTRKTIQIEKWSNGTKLQMSFRHILNPSDNNSTQLPLVINGTESQPRQYFGLDSPPPREVVVNYKKWITNTTAMEIKKAPESKAGSVSPSAILASVYYPDTDIVDGLQFVLEGSYEDVFVSYDHDDNYNEDGYHPLEVNTPYHLSGDQIPYHIHLIKDLLDAWVAGNLSMAETVGITFIARYCLGDLIRMGLARISAKVAAILGSPVVVAILFIIDIAEAIQAFLKLLGFVKAADWVINVVTEKFLGDGWTWRGPILGREYIGWYWIPYRTKPMTGIGIYAFREFNQTWGSEGIFDPNPHECSVAWYDRTEWLTAPTSAALTEYKMGRI